MKDIDRRIEYYRHFIRTGSCAACDRSEAGYQIGRLEKIRREYETRLNELNEY